MAIDVSQGADQGASGQTVIYTQAAVTTSCPITIVGWINPEGDGSGWGGGSPIVFTIVRNNFPADSTGGGFDLGMDVSGSQWRVRAIVHQDPAGAFNQSLSDFVGFDSEWHHVAAAFDGTTNQPTLLLAYVDGIAGAPNSNPPTGIFGRPQAPTGLNWTSFGGQGPQITANACYREGCGADWAVYSAYLTAEEVAELASGARPNTVRPDNLILWLKFTDAASATVNEVGSDYTSALAPSGGAIDDCVSEPPFVPEPPSPSASGTAAYYIERMDNRIWPTIEDAWCLDSALELPQPAPDATLVVSSATGGQNITEYNIINGGSGYTSPTAQITDIAGGGANAVCTLGLTGGVVTSAAATAFGSGYKHPSVAVLDSTGVGAVIQPIVTNYVTLSTNTSSFTASDVGAIVRAGGGRIEITTVSDVTTATGNIISPITYVIPNDPANSPAPVTSGQWTMTQPTMTVSGLWHLEGLTVAALADGGVVTDLSVVDGSVTLPYSASQILVGLPFIAQAQTMYLDAGAGPTVQTRRKGVTQTVLRVEGSRPPEIGTNQPDAAAQPNQADIQWGQYPYTSMTQIVTRTPFIPAGQPAPLFSGDLPISNVFTTWDEKGQIAVQQRDPVPLTLTAIVPWLTVGDSTGT